MKVRMLCRVRTCERVLEYVFCLSDFVYSPSPTRSLFRVFSLPCSILTVFTRAARVGAGETSAR
jgi:hypothetical protein